jgi:hypothetical protein
MGLNATKPELAEFSGKAMREESALQTMASSSSVRAEEFRTLRAASDENFNSQVRYRRSPVATSLLRLSAAIVAPYAFKIPQAQKLRRITHSGRVDPHGHERRQDPVHLDRGGGSRSRFNYRTCDYCAFFNSPQPAPCAPSRLSK